MRERVGGLHTAPLIVWSFDFGVISDLQEADRDDEVVPLLEDAARRLEVAGAEALLLACNAEHRAADAIRQAVSIPFLHIADGPGKAAVAAGLKRPGLVGTRFVSTAPFYRDYLGQHFGLDVVMPDAGNAEAVHAVIVGELVKGQATDHGRATLQRALEALKADGADGAILACTELEMLSDITEPPLPMFDSTTLHVAAAIDFIAGEKTA